MNSFSVSVKKGSVKGKERQEALDSVVKNHSSVWDRLSGLFKKEKELEEAHRKIIASWHDNTMSRRERDAAVVLDIVMRTGLRRGVQEAFDKTRERGVRTLHPDDANVHGMEVTFSFKGKYGVRNKVTIADADLAHYVSDRKRASKSLKHEHLFDTSDYQVDRVLKNSGAPAKHVKDLRSLLAAKVATKCLADAKDLPDGLKKEESLRRVANLLLEASVEASDVLDHEPSMSSESYVHPEVFYEYLASSGLDGLIPTGEDPIHEGRESVGATPRGGRSEKGGSDNLKEEKSYRPEDDNVFFLPLWVLLHADNMDQKSKDEVSKGRRSLPMGTVRKWGAKPGGGQYVVMKQADGSWKKVKGAAQSVGATILGLPMTDLPGATYPSGLTSFHGRTPFWRHPYFTGDFGDPRDVNDRKHRTPGGSGVLSRRMSPGFYRDAPEVRIFLVRPELKRDASLVDEALLLVREDNEKIWGNKQVSAVAKVEDRVVGAVFDEVVGDKFSVEVIVPFRERGQGITDELLEYAEDEYKDHRNAYGKNLKFELVATDPNQNGLMQDRGYKTTVTGPGTTFLLQKSLTRRVGFDKRTVHPSLQARDYNLSEEDIYKAFDSLQEEAKERRCHFEDVKKSPEYIAGSVLLFLSGENGKPNKKVLDEISGDKQAFLEMFPFRRIHIDIAGDGKNWLDVSFRPKSVGQIQAVLKRKVVLAHGASIVDLAKNAFLSSEQEGRSRQQKSVMDSVVLWTGGPMDVVRDPDLFDPDKTALVGNGKMGSEWTVPEPSKYDYRVAHRVMDVLGRRKAAQRNVFRGLLLSKEYVDAIKEDGHIDLGGPSSFYDDVYEKSLMYVLEKASQSDDGIAVVLELKTDKGSDVRDLSVFRHENEFVVSGKLQVEKTEEKESPRGEKYIVIHCKTPGVSKSSLSFAGHESLDSSLGDSQIEVHHPLFDARKRFGGERSNIPHHAHLFSLIN